MMPPRKSPLPCFRFFTSPSCALHDTSLDALLPRFLAAQSSSSPSSHPFDLTSFSSLSFHPNRSIISPSPASSVHPRSTFKITLHSSIPSGFAPAKSFSSSTFDPSSTTIPLVSAPNSPFQDSPPIDAGSSIRKPISLWPGIYHSPVTNALWEARSSIFERSVDSPIVDSTSQPTLVTKTPGLSRTSILYNLSRDLILREQYRNFCNEIRIGNLIEDLDALAGTISYKHCCDDDNTTRPLLLVTASVDKMVLKKRLRIDTDMKIVGAVTWVGRSSMEIQLEVIQSVEGHCDPVDSVALTANFTFVARDSKTGKSTPVHQISPETEQEISLWKEAEERNRRRKDDKVGSRKDTENGGVMLALLAEGRILCDMPALADRDSMLIRDTRLQNSILCQPQQRNIHGRIFGGFLMHRAFELAFSTVYIFAGTAPRFLEVGHVDFLRPVDVGDFLLFKSCVLCTEHEIPALPLIHVEVVAHVTRPELRASEVSNKFHFTFTIGPDAARSGLKIRKVYPATEEEAQRVLEHMDTGSSYLAPV